MQGFRYYKARPLYAKRNRFYGYKNTSFLMFFALLLIGVLTGAIFEEVSRITDKAYITYFVQQVLEIYKTNFLSVMGFSFISAFFIHAIIIFASFSCVGLPIIVAIPFLKGAYFGCISGYLYGTMGLKGVLANLLICFLPQIGESLLIIYLAVVSSKLSITLFKYLIRHKSDEYIKTQDCIQAFLYASLCLILTSACLGLSAMIFSPVFLS